MTYEESLAWLYAKQQFGIKLGLENIRSLLSALGDPHENVSFLHVAGTNGKGSTCAMMDAILRASGRRTGLYTSPHLVDFRERIRVDGEKMPAEAVAAGLTVLRELSEEWSHSPTFFELATALGFWHFAKSGCEFVVLETGMGGRLDATNVVRPLVSVITPIAFDHTRWLGDTLTAIASEKAGIIKPGVPVISARQEPGAAAELLRQANALSAPLLFVEDPLRSYEIGLRGEHQKKNAAVAVAALQAASIPLDDAAISHGLRELHWPGRFQVVNERLVLDGCHNPHAAVQLQHTWTQVFGSEKATVIFGALADKAYPAMLELLQPISREFFFVPVASQRAADPLSLGAECKGTYRIFPSGREALERAQGKTLVTGSLFLVGEILEALGLET